MREALKVGLLAAIAFNIALGCHEIRDAINRGNSFYLCTESAKLGLHSKFCADLMEQKP